MLNTQKEHDHGLEDQNKNEKGDWRIDQKENIFEQRRCGNSLIKLLSFVFTHRWAALKQELKWIVILKTNPRETGERESYPIDTVPSSTRPAHLL